jgi:hypothetical protein
MPYDKQNLKVEWVFVCRSISTEPIWSNVFYGGKMLPNFFHEMGLTIIMVQIWQCFMKQDCLNILMIVPKNCTRCWPCNFVYNFILDI